LHPAHNVSGTAVAFLPSVLNTRSDRDNKQALFRPRVAITLGDLAGVGPELTVRLLADPKNTARADFLVVADRGEVEAAAAEAKVTLPPLTKTPGPGTIAVIDDGSAPAVPIRRAAVSKEAGERAMHQLRRAVALVNGGQADAIVFTPLNKASLHMAGMDEHDQLRWFAKHMNHTGPVSEINIHPALWTSRVTSHVALKDVSSHLTIDGVNDAIQLLHTLL
jgi:4-hydroxythreonine-4-phosphate dehydrogenase